MGLVSFQNCQISPMFTLTPCSVGIVPLIYI
jgi:hypothetical protein